jgi:hypothetical protein
MKALIFLGPSLSIQEAKAILPDAMYLPPAGQADLLSAVTTHRPDVIGLVDGVFSQSLAVWHKEILYALEQGVRVYGSSSMGALRAAETDVFGMVGVGKIYQMYKSGELTDDDEVALVHGTAQDGYLPLSAPMVNIRMTLKRAVEEEVVDAATAEKLIGIAKALYYPERSFQLIFRRAASDGVPQETTDALEEFVEGSYVDVKKQDAVELLETIKALPETLPPLEVDFSLTRSHLFEALYDRDRAVSHSGFDVPLGAIASYVALHLPDFLTFNFNALNRVLVLVLAEILQVEVTEQAVADETRRFRIGHGLRKTAQFHDWLAENDLIEAEFNDLMREQALCRRLQRWLMTKLHLKGSVRALLDALRLENRYVEWADKAARQEKILHDHYPFFLQTDHNHIQIEQLLVEHLQTTDCRMDVHYPIWLEEAGFDSSRHLWLELLRAKLARDYIIGVTEGAASSASGNSPGQEGRPRESDNA